MVSLGSAETRPSIRAVQRCFVRSNSISEEFLYRGPTTFPNRPRGQRALRRLHKARNTHNTPRVWEQTPHSSPHLRLGGGGFKRAEMTEKLTGVKCESCLFTYSLIACISGTVLMCRAAAGCGSYQVVVLVISEEGNPSFLTTAQLH